MGTILCCWMGISLVVGLVVGKMAARHQRKEVGSRVRDARDQGQRD